MVAHICNPRTQEAEAGGFQVRGQSWLHSKKKVKKTAYRMQITDPIWD
jgi:hypothetical protein